MTDEPTSAPGDEPISVALVDDQPLVRTGFAMLINSQDDMRTVWEAGDGADVPGQAHADIVLMDVQMPQVNGIDATRELLARDATTKVVMLTTFDDQDFVTGAIEAGASGFLLKDAQPEELLSAIRVVHAGQAVLAPKATARVLSMLRQGQPHAPVETARICELTPREHEVLRLMALGLSNEEIAAKEFVSMATVKTHVRHILMKTHSRDRVHAVLCAYRSGLVTTEELLRHP